MDHFIHRENLAHYRRLLAEPTLANDPVRHKLLIRLLADEKQGRPNPMTNDSRARLQVAALIYCIVNAAVFGIGMIAVLGVPALMSPCVFRDTRSRGGQLRNVSATGMVHRAMDDDALHQEALNSMKTKTRVLLIAAFLALPVSALGQPLAGDPLKGRQTATAICAPCHQTDGRPPDGAAPTFLDVANRPSTTALSLKVFLRTSHNEMPNLIISDADTDDLIAYILDLKRPSDSKRP
jgi:mono/diheme cytochrome c family protein